MSILHAICRHQFAQRECRRGSAGCPGEFCKLICISDTPKWGHYLKNKLHEFYEFILESVYDKEDHLMNVKYLNKQRQQKHNHGCVTEMQI